MMNVMKNLLILIVLSLVVLVISVLVLIVALLPDCEERTEVIAELKSLLERVDKLVEQATK